MQRHKRFARAWAAGLLAAGGFALELKDVALTPEPKQYTIDLSRVRYGKVVGGFGWVAGGRTSALVLFIDDLQWS